MQNNNKTKWQWPAELDALIAAPQHHRLLFENEKVRVIDTLIPPGETTAVHTHQWPASLYILSWSDFTRYDSEGHVVLDSGNILKQPEELSAMWTEPLIPHALKNTGNKDLHIISIELKS